MVEMWQNNGKKLTFTSNKKSDNMVSYKSVWEICTYDKLFVNVPVTGTFLISRKKSNEKRSPLNKQ